MHSRLPIIHGSVNNTLVNYVQIKFSRSVFGVWRREMTKELRSYRGWSIYLEKGQNKEARACYNECHHTGPILQYSMLFLKNGHQNLKVWRENLTQWKLRKYWMAEGSQKKASRLTFWCPESKKHTVLQ